tara:strand:- start:153 stop:656 length:504 start_codon:yes stop_codon:yes gene_type:complete
MEGFTNYLLHEDWPQQASRKNVMEKDQESYDGFVLGKVRSWAGKKEGKTGRCIVDSLKTERPKYKIIFEMASELMKEYDPKFKFTSIQFNRNHKMKKHKDGNNVGVSYIIGLGNYLDGELKIWDLTGEYTKIVDIKDKFYKFDGSKHYHETQDFIGDRITLVYYCVT